MCDVLRVSTVCTILCTLYCGESDRDEKEGDSQWVSTVGMCGG